MASSVTPVLLLSSKMDAEGPEKKIGQHGTKIERKGNSGLCNQFELNSEPLRRRLDAVKSGGVKRL